MSLLITSQVRMVHCTHSGPREVGKASPLGLRSPANATLTGWLSLGYIRNQETVCGANLWQGRWVGREEMPVSCGPPAGVSGGDPEGVWSCSGLGASRNVALPLKVQLCVLQDLVHSAHAGGRLSRMEAGLHSLSPRIQAVAELVSSWRDHPTRWEGTPITQRQVCSSCLLPGTPHSRPWQQDDEGCSGVGAC